MMNDKKRFPPIFWLVFLLLVILNLSVFIDYRQPLERYRVLADVEHIVEIKAGSVLKQITRGDQLLSECRLATSAKLKWLGHQDEQVIYQLMPSSMVSSSPSVPSTLTKGVDNDDQQNCQYQDQVAVSSSSEDNHNTQLILLSIDFKQVKDT